MGTKFNSGQFICSTCVRTIQSLVLVHDLSSPDPTSPPGGDQTDLATSGSSSLHGGGLSNMLVITSSMGMLHGVHSHTTNLEKGEIVK